MQRNTSSPEVREAFTSVLAASLPFELLSLFVGKTRKSYRSARAAYSLDPHYIKRHDLARQNSIRRSSSDLVLSNLLEHFLHHASYVAFHTRTVHPPSDTSHSHTFPSLVSDLSPSHHYHDYCSMFPLKSDRVGRTIYFRLFSYFFDNRQRAKAGLCRFDQPRYRSFICF